MSAPTSSTGPHRPSARRSLPVEQVGGRSDNPLPSVACGLALRASGSPSKHKMAFIAAKDDLEHLFTANQCSKRTSGSRNGRNCVERRSKSTDTPADGKPAAGELLWYQGRVTWPVRKR